MDTSNLKIIPPEGMEYYIENGEVRFREIKKNLTYNDIVKNLFYHNKTYYIDTFGNIKGVDEAEYNYMEANNCTSEKQAQKLLAINKLMNIAKYLNGDWKPDWNNYYTHKYYIFIDKVNENISISHNDSHCNYCVYFKSKELAQQAIEILGEETIKLALCTDW